ncbi:DNA alkylation repair protein [Aquisalimonas sp.]|uniref:DNA alkylation repair protein n=1 Tax=Aquisalimonas sp. TaxID=1872621 RepID=UPI0025C2C8F8|nr:DNA alkylation repair protein [Aquisalimonas sp.]
MEVDQDAQHAHTARRGLMECVVPQRTKDGVMLKVVLTELEQNLDLAYRSRVQKHFNMDVQGFMGVPTPVVRKIAASTLKDIKPAPFSDVLVLCEELLKTGVYECKIIAFDLVFRRRRSLEVHHFSVLERWLYTYVNDWTDCDDLCTHALGFLIAENPSLAESSLRWTRSGNRWVRRGSAVSLIYGLRRGFLLDAALQSAERLLKDSDPLVQKGYGWMLKEASKCCPERVFDFVMKSRWEMPRTSLRYAIEKLPEGQRQEALAKSEQQGHPLEASTSRN